MNQTTNDIDAIIKAYLDKVAASLPDYVRKDQSESADILAEIKERVLDKAEAIASGEVLSPEHVRQAIETTGNPARLAKTYRRKGTPKLFVSKELWPFYKTLLLIVFGAIVLANVVALVVSLLSGEGPVSVLQAIGGIQAGFFGGFTVVTLIFFWLSAEGYTPQDFDEKQGTRGKSKPVEKPFSKKGKLVEACIGLVMGIVVVALPATSLLAMANPTFLACLQVLGIAWIAGSMLALGEGLVGTGHLNALVGLRLAGTAVALLSIIPLALLVQHPEIVPAIYFQDGIMITTTMPADLLGFVAIGMGSIIAIIVVASVVDMVETFMTRRKVLRAAA